MNFIYQHVPLLLQEQTPVVSEHETYKVIEEREEKEELKKNHGVVGGQLISFYNFTSSLDVQKRRGFSTMNIDSLKLLHCATYQ